MKVFVALLCAVASAAAGGAVAWPGAIPLSVPLHTAQIKTIIPSQVNGFAYSTSQYINAVPAQGYQPQFGYQLSLPGYPAYSPVLAAPYYPPNNFLYPSPAPIAPAASASPIGPIAPAQPAQSSPSSPSEQPAGDEDTAVIESAEFSPNQQEQPSGQTSQTQPQPQFPAGFPSVSQSSLDTKNMPGLSQIPQLPPPFPQQIQPGTGFPQYPQFPQLPQFPQIPQFPQQPESPQFPQFPQQPQFPQLPESPQFPQFPQQPQFPQLPESPPLPELPQFPQFPQQPEFPQVPQLPSNPSLPQTPPSGNPDKGINDEDTVSVDSA